MKRFVLAGVFLAAIGIQPRTASASCDEYTFVGVDQCMPVCDSLGQMYGEYIWGSCANSCYYNGFITFTFDWETGELFCTPGESPPPPPPPPPPVEKTVILLHGRAMTGWPGCQSLPDNVGLPAAGSDGIAQINASWPRYSPPYDGSARLADPAVKAAVQDALLSRCTGGKECVIACYSTGCARALIAFADIGPQLTGLHWTFAIASSAGGTELASVDGWIRDAAAAVLNEVPSLERPVDADLTVDNMRNTYGYIQDASPKPMYHVGGTGDFCLTTGLKTGALWNQTFGNALELLCGGGNTGAFLGWLGTTMAAEAVEVTMCGNDGLEVEIAGVKVIDVDSKMKGAGDGVVPLHSALGYRTAGEYTGLPTSSSQLYYNRVALQVSPHNHPNMLQYMGCPPAPTEGESQNTWLSNFRPSNSDWVQQCGLFDDIIDVFGPSSWCDDACQNYYYYQPYSYAVDVYGSSCPACYTDYYLTQCYGSIVEPSTGTCELGTYTYYMGTDGPYDCYTGAWYQPCQGSCPWNTGELLAYCQAVICNYEPWNCYDPWAMYGAAIQCVANGLNVPYSVAEFWLTQCH
jgi:hypothetical protein